MKLRETRIIIESLYNHMGDDSGLPQFYIVCNEYFCTLKIGTKKVGQDGGDIPFQDIESTEAYILLLLNKKDTKHLDKIIKLLNNDDENSA
jgi:hypothetical protein